MLTPEQLHQFAEQGFIVLENAFDPEEMDALAQRIDSITEEHNRKIASTGERQEGISRANEITFTAHLVKKDEIFQQFCAHETLVDVTTTLLGPDVSLYWEQAVYKRQETKRDFPWHQDNGYGNLAMLDPYLTCWIALADATVENGCIWVMPGSHKGGIVEHRPTPIGLQCYFGEDPGVPVALKKGGMAVFSSMLFHRSGPNVSDTVRKGYIVQYSKTGTVNAKTGEPFRKVSIAKNGQRHLDLTHLDVQDNHAAAP